MSFVTPGTPNITDFWTFLETNVQIPTAALPSNSAYPGYALDQAIGLVLCPPGGVPAPVMYSLACYNAATHILFTITPDQPGQNYFTNARSNKGYSLVLPSTGLVVTTFDQGTGATNTAPKWADGLTPSQLGFYKTPWGREYLSWQASYGPSIVGLT